MAETQVATYDPAKLMDAVRDRIKAEFVGLIPEETWKQMVQTEVKRFFEVKERNGYSHTKSCSDFQSIVSDELDKATRKRLGEYLNGPEWQSQWDGQKDAMGEAVKKFMVERSGEVLATILGNAFQEAIRGMRQHMH